MCVRIKSRESCDYHGLTVERASKTFVNFLQMRITHVL